MKIVNTDEENLNMLPTPGGISIKFSEKMCLMMVLKVTKIKGLPLCQKMQFWNNNSGGGWG